jgi:TonB family protein
MLAAPLAALLLAAPAAPTAAGPKAPFWRVDWGDARCVLARDGGTAVPSFVLRYVPGDRHSEIWIVGPGWGKGDVAGADSVRLLIDAPGAEPIGGFKAVALPNGGYALGTEQVDSDFVYAFPAATFAAVQKKGREVLRIPLPDAAKAMAATHACEDDLLKHWGVDPAVFRNLRQPPKAISQSKWFSESDYPDAALRKNATGKVYARVNVSAEGKVTGCDVAISSGSPDLDKTTCGLILRNGRYRPAVAADGRPVASLTITYITWLIALG